MRSRWLCRRARSRMFSCSKERSEERRDLPGEEGDEEDDPLERARVGKAPPRSRGDSSRSGDRLRCARYSSSSTSSPPSASATTSRFAPWKNSSNAEFDPFILCICASLIFLLQPSATSVPACKRNRTTGGQSDSPSLGPSSFLHQEVPAYEGSLAAKMNEGRPSKRRRAERTERQQGKDGFVQTQRRPDTAHK